MRSKPELSGSPENEAQAFVQHIEDCINDSLAVAKKDDQADLERALNALRPSFDELASCFLDPLREQKPALCEHGYYMLWSLISSAFVAGSRATISESAQSYASRLKALKQPSSKVKQRQMNALKEVLAELYPTGGWNKDEKEARNVRPHLLKKLRLHEDKRQFDSVAPKLETVRKYLLDIERD